MIMGIKTSDEDGKLDIARRELDEHLSGISERLGERHGITFASPSEIDVLRAAPRSHVHASAAAGDGDGVGSSAIEEGEAYRCKCTFQIVAASSLADQCAETAGDAETSATNAADHDMIFVTREDGRLCSLPDDIFPPANVRIRRAMLDLLDCLNRHRRCDNVDMDGCKASSRYVFQRLRDNLTSATFVTSWGDAGVSDSQCGGDCLVTLHYGPPGLPASKEDTIDHWKEEANMLCNNCQFTSITGRSKGVKLSISGLERRSNKNNDHDELDAAIREEGIIHDDLWLTLREIPSNCFSKQLVEIERVALVPPELLISRIETANLAKDNQNHVRIHYSKPATAFQHPNAAVMLTSLHWILNVLSKIAKESASYSSLLARDAGTIMSDAKKKPKVLEMYCGCGAHTVPLAKSTLLSEIVAVELDERLVNACRNNCWLNNCLKDDSVGNENDNSSEQSDARTLVQVFKGDATEWAAKTLRRQRKQNAERTGQTAGEYINFDILLVDPPRDGLSSTVCDMALKGTFDHVIYVSCGRRALLRDFAILCDGAEGFDVVDLAVIDLFPGTDAVESLVHLKRRR